MQRTKKMYTGKIKEKRFSYGELKPGPKVPYLEEEEGIQGLTKETT
jgi:hypothetical protein